MEPVAAPPEPAPPETLSATRAVQRVVAALAADGMAVVTDDADREDEGDLVLAAGSVTAEQVAFVVRHTFGIICAPMTAQRADALRLPPMVAPDTDRHGTAFTVTADHVGSGTGVSAENRANTLRALADPGTRPCEPRRPGHTFPLRAAEGGVLVRAGHTEAAVDLLRLAGQEPVGVIGELVGDDGAMLRGEPLLVFARRHDLPVLAIADLVRHRRSSARLVEHVATSTTPTVFGGFRAAAHHSGIDGGEHLALVLRDVAEAGRSERGALVRVHSECLTGDIPGSPRCDCGAQLEQALGMITAEGCGVLVYLRGHEGRGIGLAHKIRAYALQDVVWTRSTPTPPSGCRSTRAATAPGTDPERPRCPAAEDDDEQSSQVRGPRRARPDRRGTDSAAPHDTPYTSGTGAPSATAWATTCRPEREDTP